MNEFARYLASYLLMHREEWEDVESLTKVIQEFIDTQQ